MPWIWGGAFVSGTSSAASAASSVGRATASLWGLETAFDMAADAMVRYAGDDDSEMSQSGSLAGLTVALLLGLSVVAMATTLVATRCRFTLAARDVHRFVAFVVLHVADYVTNVMVILICFVNGKYTYLYVLGPAHCLIGVFCTYTAATKMDWMRWTCPVCCNMLFLIFGMGLMQGVQLKLAHDDFLQQLALHSDGAAAELRVPAMMPARFHCKGMDGILEGSIFCFMSLYALLWRPRGSENNIEEWEDGELAAFYACALLSVATTGLSIMEVDHRTSAAMQRKLAASGFTQACHLVFRISELFLRVMTLLVLIALLNPTRVWWLAYVMIGVDYFVGVVLLFVLGGREPIRQAPFILGLPLLAVNVAQFLDTPGLTLQARRISMIVVPTRAVQVVIVFFLALLMEHSADADLGVEDEPNTAFTAALLRLHPLCLTIWAASGICYFVLLMLYACKVRPEADLHSAIAFGEVDALKLLLRGSDLVLDVNRYGPDGRTPLHLAAAHGQIDCLRLLLEERADVYARTGDKHRNTAMHLAATGRSPGAALAALVSHCSGDSRCVNAANADGDTPLHRAAKRHCLAAVKELLRVSSINLKVRNARGLTAAEHAPSDVFGFDRNSAESTIADMLRKAENGTLPLESLGPDTVELSSIDSHSRSSSSNNSPGFGTRFSGCSPMQQGGASSSRSPLMADASPAFSQDRFMSKHAATLLLEGRTENDDEALAREGSQHFVRLQALTREQEEHFMQRMKINNKGPTKGPRGHEALQVSNCGLSSFLLSAGLGALSRAVFWRMPLEEDKVPISGQKEPTIDDFEEISRLGEGAFGKVCLVRMSATGELFAMKTMEKAKFKAQKIMSKAHSEQYILKTTRHPFIVTLHYAFHADTFWALVMDYCPNGDLHQFLSARGAPGLPNAECARLGGEVLLAIEHLHSIRVIFRDLKLDNVVLDADWRARVTDFGLAKKLYGLSDARTMCGSYGYVAPEIMLNTGRYTYAVDLYSFGVVMYLLLSGGETKPDSKQRLPPMRHSGLRRKLRDAEKEPRSAWAAAESGGLDLCVLVTSDDPRSRTTATAVKEHVFFRKHLGFPLDSLLTMSGFQPLLPTNEK